MALKELVSTFSLADIALLKSLLDGEGIRYLAQGEEFHALRQFIEPVRFLVPEEDLDRAQQLIEGLNLAYAPLIDLTGKDASEEDDSRETTSR